MKYSYITVLSNWILGYDRYTKIYSKHLLKKSTFKDVFYLLKENELEIGLNKASSLLKRINKDQGKIVSNDHIIKINTIIEDDVFKNTKNGLGWYVNRNFILVDSVQIFDGINWIDISIEDISAKSFLIEYKNISSYKELAPRSLSFLPVAQACQAKCKFCFSESSISTEQIKKIEDFTHLDYWCSQAKNKGADRFVITGGGEPSIIGIDNIVKILDISTSFFDKNVLITNGMFLLKDTSAGIDKLHKSKLSVLAISCHHYDNTINQNIMGIDTGVHDLLKNIKDIKNKPLLRLVCVLQNCGIHDQSEIDNYIDFALENNITQICFKELYVSSTTESMYSKSFENIYCKDNQIPLKIILDYAKSKNLIKTSELPWGCPIFRLTRGDKNIDIAAYTEPSVGWERFHGIARSWNYMADNHCYSTLEDLNSKLDNGEKNEL